MRICKLARDSENPLLLQLEPRDEKLRADAGACHLIDLGSERTDLRKQGIFCRTINGGSRPLGEQDPPDGANTDADSITLCMNGPFPLAHHFLYALVYLS